MILSFHPVFTADEQIILGVRSPDEGDLRLIREADAIILPQGRADKLQRACVETGARTFPNYELRFKYPGKVGQSLLFEDYGFSQPRTLRWHTVAALTSACPGFEALPHEMPFLIKADRAHEAEGIYLIDRREALSAALDQIRERESSGQAGFVSQDYVPSEGNALRAVIIGDRILTYWKRPREPHTRIATISRGAEIDPAWRPDLQEKGREAAKRLAVRTRINLAAVDFVFPLNQKEPTPLFLEINYFFARRGLGGNEAYYGMVHEAIRTWLKRHGLDPESVKRV